MFFDFQALRVPSFLLRRDRKPHVDTRGGIRVEQKIERDNIFERRIGEVS